MFSKADALMDYGEKGKNLWNTSLQGYGKTFISMGISIFIYSYIFSWPLSFGIVLMIFIHEMGHMWAAKNKGIAVSTPIFIPFIGAIITFQKLPKDAQTEAFIAFGGPLIGSLGATLSFLIGYFTQNELLYVIALLGFILNLFNLIPIAPLDGGRIATAITRWLWVPGFCLTVGMIIWMKNYLLILVLVIFIKEIPYSIFKKQDVKRWYWKGRTEIERQRFDQAGIPSPASNPPSNLQSLQYCNIEDQVIYTQLLYPGIGKIKEFSEGQFSGLVKEIQVIKVKERKKKVNVIYKVYFERSAFRDPSYFQVPHRMRMAFGGVYIALSSFLIMMVYIVSQVMSSDIVWM